MAFAEFKSESIAKYGNGVSIFTNPGYLGHYVLSKMGDDPDYKEPLDLIPSPNNIDPEFSYQLHYIRAYAYLRHCDTIDEGQKGTKWKEIHTQNAREALCAAKSQIDHVVVPSLQSAILQLGAEATNTPLYKQLDNKMRLYDTASRNMQENLDFIQNEFKPGKNTIKIGDNLQLYRDVCGDQVDRSDIEQFERFGMPYIFHATAKSYAKDYLSGTFVAIVGLAQVVVGAVLAIGSGGFAANFGMSLAVGGFDDIVDGFKAATAGQPLDLGQWAKGKGIQLGISMAMAAIPGRGGAPAQTAGKTAGEQAVKTRFTEEAIKKFAGEFVQRVAISQLTQIGVNYAVEKVSQSSASPIKAEMKKLREAVKKSFHTSPTYDRICEICQADVVQRAITRQEAVYQRKLGKAILSVLDRKSDQFARIAQNVLVGAASKMVGGGMAGTALAVANVGASVVKLPT